MLLPEQHYEQYKEVIDKVLEDVIKERPGFREMKSVCNYRTVDFDGRVTLDLPNAACYAYLRTLSSGTIVILNQMTEFSGVSPLKQSVKDCQKMFYSWLANRSPWKNAFISKDVDAVMDTGWMAVQTSQPANYVVGALITTRNMWETPNVMFGWVKLVEAGCDEDLAWIISHSCMGLLHENVLIQNHPYHGHISIGLEILYLPNLSNFLKGKIVCPLTLFKDNPNYMAINEMWGLAYGQRLSNLLDRFGIQNGKPQDFIQKVSEVSHKIKQELLAYE